MGIRVVVAVVVGVAVGAFVAVLVAVFVAVLVTVLVAVLVGALVAVAVSVGVSVGTAVAVSVGVSVGTAVFVTVSVGTVVAVSVGVSVGTTVSVGVSVGTAVAAARSVRHPGGPARPPERPDRPAPHARPLAPPRRHPIATVLDQHLVGPLAVVNPPLVGLLAIPGQRVSLHRRRDGRGTGHGGGAWVQWCPVRGAARVATRCYPGWTIPAGLDARRHRAIGTLGPP